MWKCPLLTDQMVSKVGKVMKKMFLDKVWAPKCGKSGLFQKLALALGIGLGLAFEIFRMFTFDEPPRCCLRLGKWWKKCFWSQFGPQSVEKWTFFKARVNVRVKVLVSFWICENVHFRRTRWCPRLGKWWKKFWGTTFGPQSVEKVDFFFKS